MVMYWPLRKDAVAWRGLTPTSCRFPVLSSQRSETARPTAPRLAAAAWVMRKGVGKTGSAPPENSTLAGSWTSRPATERSADKVSFITLERAPFRFS